MVLKIEPTRMRPSTCFCATACRVRSVAAGVAEDDLVPSAAKLALDGVGCAGIVGIPDVHRENGHRVQALADHALCNGTGSVAAAFEHLFHLGAGVGADSIFVVEHAGDGADAHVCKLCNILDGHADAPPAMIPETLPVTFPILAYSIAPTAGKVK